MTSPLRLLLWLKWTLTWRGYRRSRSKVFGAIIFLVAFVPLSGVCAYGLWVLEGHFPNLAAPLARDALTVVFLLWAATPLLGFPLNESFDLTRLFVYPISHTRLFVGALLGGLMDRAVLLVLPLLVVLLLRMSPTLAAFALVLPVLLLFLLLTLAMGQALMLLLIGFLRSRRFRDLTVVLFPLIGMGYYLGQHVLVRRMESGRLTIPEMVQAPVWQYANWLPSGWAAWGLEAARQGHPGETLLALALLGLAAAVIIALAVTSLKTLYVGDIGPSIPRIGQALAQPSIASIPLPNLRGFPPEVAAMMWKEWTYFRRDPQYKALAVQSVYTLVVLSASIALPSLRQGSWGLLPGDGLLLGVSGVLLLSLLPLLFNQWAGEGAAITALFSLPTPRRAMLLGKNAAHGSLLLVVCAVGLLVAATFGHAWHGLPLAGAWVLLAGPLLLAAGNLVSVRFPHRMMVRGQRWGRGGTASADDGTGSGCAYSLLYMLAYGATLLALLPVLAAVLLPGLFGIPALWHALTLPLAAVYSLTLYVILLRQAEVWLLTREPEIIGRIMPD
jgi:hypothetical protein